MLVPHIPISVTIPIVPMLLVGPLGVMLAIPSFFLVGFCLIMFEVSFVIIVYFIISEVIGHEESIIIVVILLLGEKIIHCLLVVEVNGTV